jgi:hypothetical protein
VRYIFVSLPSISRRGSVASPQFLTEMAMLNGRASRRMFRWPGVAREMVAQYLKNTCQRAERPDGAGLKLLITRIAAVSGNPRSACWRFARQLGVTSKRHYQPWSAAEQQKLLDTIAAHTLEEVVHLLRRSPTSIRSMLHRLGASARMGQDWFTKHNLAVALHVRAEEVQKWIDRGWLKCRIVRTNGLERQLIDATDFCAFCKEHHHEIVGYRLNQERLDFVQTFVFPPSHAELLPVRNAKKEQAAYEEQREGEALGNGAGRSEEGEELDAIT